MTSMLRELRARRSTGKLLSATTQPQRKTKAGTPEYFERMQGVAAHARAMAEAKNLRDELREYEHGTRQNCFLCSRPIATDDNAVETALGRVHDECYVDDSTDEDYGEDY